MTAPYAELLAPVAWLNETSETWGPVGGVVRHKPAKFITLDDFGGASVATRAIVESAFPDAVPLVRADEAAKAIEALQAEVERLSAAPPAVGREEIARIVSPEAFEPLPHGNIVRGREAVALAKADAILSALGRTEAPTPVAWQPIETAPRDGTKFDVWARDERITDVYWSDVQDAFCTDGDYGPEEPSPLAFFPPATHWMPLPTPPEGEG